jgi:hypothetical protein
MHVGNPTGYYYELALTFITTASPTVSSATSLRRISMRLLQENVFHIHKMEDTITHQERMQICSADGIHYRVQDVLGPGIDFKSIDNIISL